MKKLVIAFILSLCCSLSLQAQLIKEKAPIDAKYLAGAVPVENNKVVFHRTISVDDAQSLDTLYNELLNWARIHYTQSALKFQMVNRNSKELSMEFGIVEYITFKSTALVLDRSQIIYHLSLQIKDKQVEVRMHEISYYYEEERSPVKMTAEETITDNVALKKNQKSFYKPYGKFRTKTIDLFDSTCDMLQTQLQ